MLKKHTTTLTILTLWLSTSLGCGKLNDAGGDDEVDPVDQTPDGPDVPEWPNAHERLKQNGYSPYPGDQPNALNGVIVDAELAAMLPEDREYVAFAPTTPPQPDHQGTKCIYCGWPSKPFMKGIPEIPYWSWDVEGIVNGPWMTAKEIWGSAQGDLRSGLIGNFALYTPSISATDGELILFCPDEHPRPPICTSLLQQIGHPLIAGRYNAYGLACSTQEAGHFEWTDPDEDCYMHFDIGLSPASPSYPLIPKPWTEPDGVSQCLALGETYRPEIGLLSSGDRNGLTWLNLREMGDLLHFVEDTTEAAEILLEVIPWWDYSASQWNYIDIDDATWRWSEMSMTGECGFKSSLEIRYTQPDAAPCVLGTRDACPRTHFAVLPPFSVNEMYIACVQDPSYYETVDGFCGLNYFDFVANEAALLPDGSIDPIVQLDVTSNGYHRGYSLRFDAMSDELLTEWSRSIVATPTDGGIVLTLPAIVSTDVDSMRRYTIGANLLAEFGLQSGDRVVSFTSACWDEESCARDLGVDLRSSAVNVLDTLLVMQDRWLNEQVVALWIERDDGMVLPTYLFPVFVPSEDASTIED